MKIIFLKTMTSQDFLHVTCVSSVGYYVEPTILETKDPQNKLMQEVIINLEIVCYLLDFLLLGDIWTYCDSICLPIRPVGENTSFGKSKANYST